jgi:AcrR family transcriptional regulator
LISGGDVGPKERKEREKEQRREVIIAAGEKLFLKKGLQGTTMDEIARGCELSKGTLYLYFSSKEQLYFEIVFRAMEKLYQSMAEAVETGSSPLEKLALTGKGYFDFFSEHVGYFRLLNRMMDTEVIFSKDIRDIGMALQEKTMQVWGLMTSIIADGIKEGVFKPDTDPMEISISLYASTNMIMQIMDHAKRHESEYQRVMACNADAPIVDPFHGLDFDKILNNLGWRIVNSIMTNPTDEPADFRAMRQEES